VIRAINASLPIPTGLRVDVDWRRVNVRYPTFAHMNTRRRVRSPTLCVVPAAGPRVRLPDASKRTPADGGWNAPRRAHRPHRHFGYRNTSPPYLTREPFGQPLMLNSLGLRRRMDPGR